MWQNLDLNPSHLSLDPMCFFPHYLTLFYCIIVCIYLFFLSKLFNIIHLIILKKKKRNPFVSPEVAIAISHNTEQSSLSYLL